jgi:glycosyltransferase involved in cell wall biosynthesis
LRVLILVDCYIPSQKSSAKLVSDLGIEFHRRGHAVTVLTPSDQVKQDIEISTEDCVCVVRIKTPRIKGASRPLRAIHESRLSSLVWKKSRGFLKNHPADLIIFYSPTIFWGALVRRLKSLWGVPSYLILRDIFPDWAVDVGLLKKGLICRYFHRKAAQQYESADIIAVQSPGDLEYFARVRAQEPHRVKVLYNWATLQERGLPKTEYRVQFGLQGKIIFFYGGNLGAAQDVENLIRLASNLADQPEIHFLLVGEGDGIPRLQKAIAAGSLRNITLAPPVAQRDYLSMVSEFDVGLISLDRRLKNHNIPGKLLGYLYWGIPVLASVNPGSDLFDLIRDHDAGFCIINGDDEKLRAAALQLGKDGYIRSQMGKNARALLESTFSVQSAVQQILQNITEISAT